MSKIREIYKENEKNKLFEARVTLLQNEIYPFNVFLKEEKEAINAAEQIERLEEVTSHYKDVAPTLYLLVKQNSDFLMESTIDANGIEAAMVNYSFLTEAIGKYVAKAVELLKSQQLIKSSLSEKYGVDAVKLLEFSMKKSPKYKLMEGEKDQVINLLARELSNMSLKDLVSLCENIKPFRLYVSNKIHSELATVIAG